MSTSKPARKSASPSTSKRTPKLSQKRQAGAGPKYVVRRSAIHGRGVFARRLIKENETVIEYKGEIIKEDEIERRYPESREQPNHTFIFGVEYDYNIDGGAQGNAARWINHSCQPNCDTYEEDRRIYIRAIRDIRPGEELSYDYAIEAGEPLTAKLKACWPCWCGARNCRGTVLIPSKRKSRRNQAPK